MLPLHKPEISRAFFAIILASYLVLPWTNRFIFLTAEMSIHVRISDKSVLKL